MDKRFSEIGVQNIALHRDMALSDLDALEYVLVEAYSGAPREGAHVAACIDAIRTRIARQEAINAADFFDTIAAELTCFEDFHLVMSLPYFSRKHTFCRHNQVFFADEYACKNTQGGYTLAGERLGELHGAHVLLEEHQVYPTFPDEMGERYLIGVMQKNAVQHMRIATEAGDITLPVHAPSAVQHGQRGSLWTAQTIQGIDVVTCSRLTFFSKAEQDALREFADYGRRLRAAEAIILDLRGNPGGDSGIALTFLHQLNTAADFSLAYEKRDTPLSRRSERTMRGLPLDELRRAQNESWLDGISSWNIHTPPAILQGTYHNPFYVLVDAQTASSAEIFIKLCRDYIDTCVIVGENTKGCLNTGDIRYFYLPHSHIALDVPTAAFPGVFEEGTGFLPDVWLDCEQPVEAVIRHILSSRRP